VPWINLYLKCKKQFLRWIHAGHLSVLDRWNFEAEGWERVVRVAMAIADWRKTRNKLPKLAASPAEQVRPPAAHYSLSAKTKNRSAVTTVIRIMTAYVQGLYIFPQTLCSGCGTEKCCNTNRIVAEWGCYGSNGFRSK
jgi:hypothetical protein